MASQEGDSQVAQSKALNQLCRLYWKPLYIYLRRTGHEAVDAEDLTQDFLSELLRRDAFETVSPEKGRFRSFLIASLKNFLSHHREKASAQKRAGGKLHLSLNDPTIEAALQGELANNDSPEAAFDRRWAVTLLERVRERVRAEYVAGGKDDVCDSLMPFLPGGDGTGTQQEIAETLGFTVPAVKSELYRMRRRFGQYVRAEVANTVIDPSQIDDELEHLIQVLQ